MTNPYYIAGTITPHTLARGTVLQAQLTAIEAAFTLLNTDLTNFSQATSTTSLLIGTGVKALTIASGHFIQIGQNVRIASTASPTNYMDGQVTAYDAVTGACSVTVTSTLGAGTFAAWVISLIPPAANLVTTDGNGNVTISGTSNANQILNFNNSSTGASAQVVMQWQVGGRNFTQSVNYAGQYLLESGAGIVIRIADFDTQIWRTTASVERMRLSSAGLAMTGVPITGAAGAAGASGTASFNAPHGAAPTTTLANGDIWTTTAGFFVRVNGATLQMASRAGAETLTNKRIQDTAFTIADAAAFEIDPANGGTQTIVLGANRTPKATNFAAGDYVELRIDDGTAYSVTWTDATFGGSGVAWTGPSAAGSAPALATTGWTVIGLWKVGTQVYGTLIGYSA